MKTTMIWAGIGLGLVGLLHSGTAQAFECDSNLMIVLDRSCSMDSVPSGDTQTKWDSAVDALAALTTNYEGQLRFGLIMFPDETGDRCTQDGDIYVQVGPGNESAVMDAVNGTQPDGPCVTNIDTAIAQVGDDPAFDTSLVDPAERRSFVLLVTDGKQSNACGGVDRDPVTETNIAELYSANYPTYVVGFGGGVRPASLETFATAGGVPRVGDPIYYQADTAAELEEALQMIAGSVVGDPEFGGCSGLPCPDGRCYGEYEECVEGVCVAHYPDAGPMVGDQDAGTGDQGDGGAGGGMADPQGGCGCHTGGAGGSDLSWLGLALAALILGRRRRRR